MYIWTKHMKQVEFSNEKTLDPETVICFYQNLNYMNNQKSMFQIIYQHCPRNPMGLSSPINTLASLIKNLLSAT